LKHEKKPDFRLFSKDLIDFFGETRFFTGRFVFVIKPFADGAVNEFEGTVECFFGFVRVVVLNGVFHGFYGGFQTRSEGCVPHSAFFVCDIAFDL
jgi:hypothetical protein